jgi:hypothetical protein
MECIKTLKGHSDMVSAIYAEQHKLYSISTDKTLRVSSRQCQNSNPTKIWDIDTHLLAHTIDMGDELLCLSVHSHFLAIGMDNGSVELRVSLICRGNRSLSSANWLPFWPYIYCFLFPFSLLACH